MTLETAVQLIEGGLQAGTSAQHWADLGAGAGLFSRALGSLLPLGSTVTAVDQNSAALQSMPWTARDITLVRRPGDFTLLNWGNDFDGLLMANSLHYVRDAKGFLSAVVANMKPNGRIIIVEYERRSANAWVPFPIRFDQLNTVARQAGFSSVKKLHEVPSVFDDVMIYAALVLI